MSKINKAREAQEFEQEKRIIQIKKIINNFPHDSKPFRNPTQACTFVAKALSEKEGKNVSTSTLLRNKNYRSLINIKFGFNNSHAPEHQKELLATLEIRKLKNDVDALTSQLRGSLADNERLLSRLDRESKGLEFHEVEDAEKEIIYRSLLRLIEQLSGYTVDKGRRKIIDDLQEEAIAGDSDFPGFFDWLDKEIS